MDPIIVSQTARIVYEERLQSFEEQRRARLLGPNRLEAAFAALVQRVRMIVRQNAGQPAAKPVSATQEVARVNC